MTSAPATKAEFPASVTGGGDQRWGHKGSQRDADEDGWSTQLLNTWRSYNS